jgi:hypothetical protein
MRLYVAALVALVGCSGKIAEAPPFAASSTECTTPPEAETDCALCGDGWHCPTGLFQQCPPAMALTPQGDPVQARTETSRVMIGDCFTCVDGSGTEFSTGQIAPATANSPTATVTTAVAHFPCSP